MYSNNDNCDYNIFESLNIFSLEKNDFLYCNDNLNSNSMNLNKQSVNEIKEMSPDNSNNLNSSYINRNLKFLEGSNFNNLIKSKHLEAKSKKIFNILHIKRKPVIHLNSKNKIVSKIKKESNEEKGNHLLNKTLDSENGSNRNNSSLKYSLFDQQDNEHKKVKHDKFSDDNLRRKCKHIILFSIMEFINKKIYSMYKGNLGNNIYRKEILTLNKSQKSNANIYYNRIFANKKIVDILSDNISSRYTNFPPEHNKLLIERLKSDEDEDKRSYFKKFFDLTFKECLDYFIGKSNIEELKGMKRFENIKDMIREDKEYINVLRFYLENFENIIYNKTPRKTKK